MKRIALLMLCGAITSGSICQAQQINPNTVINMIQGAVSQMDRGHQRRPQPADDYYDYAYDDPDYEIERNDDLIRQQQQEIERLKEQRRSVSFRGDDEREGSAPENFRFNGTNPEAELSRRSATEKPAVTARLPLNSNSPVAALLRESDQSIFVFLDTQAKAIEEGRLIKDLNGRWNSSDRLFPGVTRTVNELLKSDSVVEALFFEKLASAGFSNENVALASNILLSVDMQFSYEPLYSSRPALLAIDVGTLRRLFDGSGKGPRELQQQLRKTFEEGLADGRFELLFKLRPDDMNAVKSAARAEKEKEIREQNDLKAAIRSGRASGYPTLIYSAKNYGDTCLSKGLEDVSESISPLLAPELPKKTKIITDANSAFLALRRGECAAYVANAAEISKVLAGLENSKIAVSVAAKTIDDSELLVLRNELQEKKRLSEPSLATDEATVALWKILYDASSIGYEAAKRGNCLDIVNDSLEYLEGQRPTIKRYGKIVKSMQEHKQKLSAEAQKQTAKYMMDAEQMSSYTTALREQLGCPVDNIGAAKILEIFNEANVGF